MVQTFWWKKNVKIVTMVTCFQFLLGITVLPREIQKFWEVNKVHYGLCEMVNVGWIANETLKAKYRFDMMG